MSYSIDELRTVLSEAIDDLRNDRSSPAAVNAISNAAGKILHTLRLHIEYQQLIGQRRPIAMLEEDYLGARAVEAPRIDDGDVHHG